MHFKWVGCYEKKGKKKNQIVINDDIQYYVPSNEIKRLLLF